MLTNPDAPVNLVEDQSGRSQTSVAFSWQEGAQNGGSAIIDYRIYMDAGEGYNLIASGFEQKTYLIDTLTPGIIYGFKVQARNAYGLSVDSEEFLILCATVPNPPNPPTTVGIDSDVIV